MAIRICALPFFYCWHAQIIQKLIDSINYLNQSEKTNLALNKLQYYVRIKISHRSKMGKYS